MSEHIKHLKKGNEYYESGLWDKALREYDQAHKLEYQIRDGWINRGFAYEYINEFKQAVQCYTHLLNLSPKNKLVWNFQGRAYQSLGRCDKAIVSFQTAIKIDRSYLLSWYNLAQAYACLMLYDKAVKSIKKALAIQPSHVDSLVSYGKFLRMQELFDESLIELDHALDIDPMHVDGLYNRGYTLGSLGRYEEASLCFDLAIQQENRMKSDRDELLKLPRRPDLSADELSYIAEGYMKSGKIDLATEFIDKSISKGTDNSQAFYLKGVLLKNSGDLKGASKFMERALEANPTHQKAAQESAALQEMFDVDHLQNGKELYDENKFEEALVSFNKHLSLDTATVEGYYYKAMCLKNLKRYVESSQSLIQLQNMDAGFKDKEVRREIENLQQIIDEDRIKESLRSAEVLINSEKFDDAIISYNEVLLLDPRNRYAISKIGYCYEKMGDLDNAYQYIARMCDLDPTDIECKDKLSVIEDKIKNKTLDLKLSKADIAFKEGNYELAYSLYKEVLSVDPHNKMAIPMKNELEKIIENNKLNDSIIKLDELYSSKLYRDALSLCDDILSIDENNMFSLLIKARCLRALDDISTANKAIDKLLAIDADNLDATLEKMEIVDILNHKLLNDLRVEGNKYFKDGLYSEALEKYNSALQIVSDDPETNLKIANTLYELLEYDASRQKIYDLDDYKPVETAILLEKIDVSQGLNSIDEQINLDKLMDAKSLLNTLLAKYPDNDKLLTKSIELDNLLNNKELKNKISVVKSLIKSEKFEDANNLLITLIDTYPGDKQLISLIKEVNVLLSDKNTKDNLLKIDEYIRSGDMGKAESMLNSMVETDEVKQRILAIDEIKHRVEIDNKLFEVESLLGSNELPKALLILKTLLVDNPGNEKIISKKSYIEAKIAENKLSIELQLVDQMSEDQKYDDAMELLNTLNDKYPYNDKITDRMNKISALRQKRKIVERLVEADLLIVDGKFDDAKVLLNVLYKIEPNNSEIQQKLDNIDLLKNEFDFNNNLVEIDNLLDNKSLEDARNQLDTLVSEYSDNDEVKSRIAKLEELERELAYTIKLNDADELSNEGAFEKALVLLNELLEVNPEDEDVRSRIAIINSELASLAKEDELKSKLTQIDNLLDSKSLEDARNQLDTLVSEYSDNDEIKSRIAKLEELERELAYTIKLNDADELSNEGAFEKALVLLNELLEVNPEDEDVRSRIAIINSELASLAKEDELKSKLTQIDNLLDSKSLEDARNQLDTLVSEYSDNEEVKSRIAKLGELERELAYTIKLNDADELSNEGAFEKALVLLNELLEVNPEGEDVRSRIAIINSELASLAKEDELKNKLTQIDNLLDNKSLEDARNQLDTLVSEYSDNDEVKSRIAKLGELERELAYTIKLNDADELSNEGAFEKALVLLNELLEVNPEGEDVRSRIAIINSELASLAKEDELKNKLTQIDNLLDNKSLEDARNQLDTLVSEYSDNDEVKSRIAKLGELERELAYTIKLNDADELSNEGAFEKAMVLLNELLEVNPEDEDVRSRIAIINSELASLAKEDELKSKLTQIDNLLDSKSLEDARNQLDTLVSEYSDNEEVKSRIAKLEGLERELAYTIKLNDADELSNEGAFEKALVLLNELLEVNPEDEDVKSRIANIVKFKALGDRESLISNIEKHINTGKYKEALSELTKLDDGEDLRVNYVDEYFKSGKENFDVKKYRDAVSKFDRVIGLDPNNTEAIFYKGLSQKLRKKNRHAHIAFDRVIKLDNEHADAYYEKGDLYLKEEKLEDAVKYLERSVDLYDKQDREEIVNAKTVLEVGKKKLSYKYLADGDVFFRKRQYRKAIDAYSKNLLLNPENATIWNNRGLAHKILKEYDNAIHCYEKALKIDPKFKNAWNNLGAVYEEQGKHDTAIENYDKALNLDPNYKQAWNNRGLALHHSGKFTDAISSFKRACDIDPKYKNPWCNRGNSLGEIDKHKDALYCFNKAIELDDKYINAISGKGQILIEMKKFDEAMIYFDKVLSLDDKHLLSILGKGVIFESKKMYKEALKYFDEVLKINPKFPSAWWFKGKVLFDMKDYRDAIRALEKAERLDKNNSAITKLLKNARRKTR